MDQRATKTTLVSAQHDTALNCDSIHKNAEGNHGEDTRERSPLPQVTFQPNSYNQLVKPAADRLFALLALVLLIVPIVIIGALVAVSMGRPVIFRQRRIGKHGKPFDVLKFRTMDKDRRGTELDVIRDRRLTHKSGNDPRHTKVGQILRKYSLDELPQLFNIVKGDMSIIGPRPELESVVTRQYPPGLEQRHLVKPGLTGLWQISARGEGPMHENGEWDLAYVEQISLLTDIKIVLKTPFAMFGRNAGE